MHGKFEAKNTFVLGIKIRLKSGECLNVVIKSNKQNLTCPPPDCCRTYDCKCGYSELAEVRLLRMAMFVLAWCQDVEWTADTLGTAACLSSHHRAGTSSHQATQLSVIVRLRLLRPGFGGLKYQHETAFCTTATSRIKSLQSIRH